MNGRIYDPKLGRFLQADPIVQFPHYSQSWNTWGISAAAFSAIGQHFSAVTGLAEGGLGHILTHGITGGILAELQGGQFGHGFLAAGISKAVMGRFSYEDGSAPAVMGRTTIAAVVGGTISRITGGKFANGALTSAMAQLFNNELSNMRERKKFVNPTGKEVRGCDSQGCGEFNAPRGSRNHQGTDYIAVPGQDVLAVNSGTITKIGYPYGDDLNYRYIQIKSADGYQTREFYVTPAEGLSIGSRVSAGQVIGTAQSLQPRYPDITDHIHVEIRLNGKVIDPASVLP